MSEKKFYKREDIVGKITIDIKGNKVGQVLDIAYDNMGRIALIVKEGDVEKYFSIDEIIAIGDFVIVGDKKKIQSLPQTKKCPKCGRENNAEYKYCVGCGTSLF